MIVAGNFMFMSMLGEDGVAAYSVGCYLFPVIFSISNAVAHIGPAHNKLQLRGEKPVRVRQALRLSLRTGALCGVAVSLAMWFGAPALSLVFLPAEAVAYGLAVHGLPSAGSERGLLFAQYSFHRLLPEHRTVRPLHCIHHIAGSRFPCPCLFILLPLVLGVDGLWLAIPAAEMLTLMVILVVILVSCVKNLAVRIKCLTLQPKTAEIHGGCCRYGLNMLVFSVLINITNQQMNYYETVFILTPVLSDDQMKEAVEKFKGILAENGAESRERGALGSAQTRLSHPEKSTGFYCLFEFKAEPDFMKKLETDFRRDERVIRFLTFRLTSMRWNMLRSVVA